MNSLLVAGAVLAGLAATIAYFYGKSRIKALAGAISSELETALHPTSTEYVNIGGLVGYHITYGLGEPWKEAKGTMTFVARHSLIYLPLSWAIGVRDRLFLTLFTEHKLAGEAHLIDATFWSKKKPTIDNLAKLERRDIEMGGRRWIALADKKGFFGTLESMSADLKDFRGVRHIACYAPNRNVYVYLVPRAGEVGPVIDALMPRFASMLAVDTKKS